MCECHPFCEEVKWHIRGTPCICFRNPKKLSKLQKIQMIDYMSRFSKPRPIKVSWINS